jgi:hypothetical protein
MIPAGYLAKRIVKSPDSLKTDRVKDIYSLSGHVSADFADYVPYWKHNGFWLFDSPEIIVQLANAIDLDGATIFYYEVYDLEYDGAEWRSFTPEASFPTHVAVPMEKALQGYNVVTFSAGAAPECSPLSCNALCEEIETNLHCLFSSLEDAKVALDSGRFEDSEPGPYRIFAVYSVDWE